MPSINTDLLKVIAALHRQGGDAHVAVHALQQRRVLHVARGNLVASDSSLKSERLGDVLASQGKLDPVLIEPVAAEAKRQARLLGDQLIADGLLQPTELMAALEGQTLLRFERTLTMDGRVEVGSAVKVQEVQRWPLGALVVAVFRDRVAIDAIEGLLASRKRGVAPALGPEVHEQLRLTPAELRLFRGLAHGEDLRSVVTNSPSPEPGWRFVAALVALELRT